MCANGNHLVLLQDEHGKPLSLEDARTILRHPKAERRVYEPDHVGTDILLRLSRTESGVTREDLAAHLRLHPERVRLCLSDLEGGGYIYSIFAGVAGAPITYHLYEKGSKFLADKSMI
jgi:predicted ArsR family transcriptional regulator